ncbi:hypothetical protein AB0M34_31810 [Nocardia sp. NPDC050193]
MHHLPAGPEYDAPLGARLPRTRLGVAPPGPGTGARGAGAILLSGLARHTLPAPWDYAPAGHGMGHELLRVCSAGLVAAPATVPIFAALRR